MRWLLGWGGLLDQLTDERPDGAELLVTLGVHREGVLVGDQVLHVSLDVALRDGRTGQRLDRGEDLRGQLEARTLTIAARAGAGGRLFGAVSQADVAEAAKAVGLTIDKRTIEFAAPVRSTGDATATVRLHPEVQATVKLAVVSA